MPIETIETIFSKLISFYGRAFVDMWPVGTDMEGVKQDWAEALADMSLEELRRGLMGARQRAQMNQGGVYRAPPVNLPEFLALCRPPLDYEVEYYDAARQMQLRLRDDQKHPATWRYRALYWAASRLGDDMLKYPYTQNKVRWQRWLDEMIQTEDLPPIPPFNEKALPKPLMSAERKKSLMAELTRIVKGTRVVEDPVSDSEKEARRQAQLDAIDKALNK